MATATARLQQMEAQEQRKDQMRDDILIPLLIRRSFHLPGNSWRQDWIQFMRNSHVLLGICFHHPKHPIETWERYIVLLGSVSFAMCATNIGYIYDWYTGEEDQFDPGAVAFTWNIESAIAESGYQTLVVTYGMLLRWTFGSTMHGLFDFFVWNLSACACCHPGGRYEKSKLSERCNDLGSILLIPVILALLAMAVYSSYLRVQNVNANLEDEYGDDLVEDLVDGRLGDYYFLARLGAELLLTWFLFFPIVSTIFFSGILGCNWRLPVLGGRPRDVRLVEEHLKEVVTVPDEKDGSLVDHPYTKFT